MEYTTIIISRSSDSPLKNVLTAFAGFQLASFSQENGQDCIVVYDDLFHHWKEYCLLFNQNQNNYANCTYLYSRFLNSIPYSRGSITSWGILPVPEEISPTLETFLEKLEQIFDKTYFYKKEDFANGKGSALWNLVNNQTVSFQIFRKSLFLIRSHLQEIENAELSSSLIEFVDSNEELPEEVVIQLDKKERLKTLFFQNSRSPLTIHEQNFLISFPVLNLFFSLNFQELTEYKKLLLSYFRKPVLEISNVEENEIDSLVNDYKIQHNLLERKNS